MLKEPTIASSSSAYLFRVYEPLWVMLWQWNSEEFNGVDYIVSIPSKVKDKL